ncbi:MULTISPECIES: hypothetical protein [unclassified Bradyrhizobium]|uniref:hypothetical protein n=1 Tax=unclassified Bradyrhizobium TaxID=2631580 RepID=UPI00291632BD|nr:MULTISPECIES: hypothetical protein [unclassified Bradyrhizobium]
MSWTVPSSTADGLRPGREMVNVRIRLWPPPRRDVACENMLQNAEFVCRPSNNADFKSLREK